MIHPLPLLKQIAIGDLLFLGVFALPVVSVWFFDALVLLNQKLGLPGIANTDTTLYLLIKLMGLFALSSAIMRLRSPSFDWVLTTILVKFVAAAYIAFAVTQNAPAILLAIAAVDGLLASLLCFSLLARHRLTGSWV